ncbi:hypothetical protein Bca52824_030471 [Brassica carinata]|uniref:TIR domain-containing protein n=1 Tax=Brassica carinata TaxID=52824 RepID=A0A8X7S8E6_BRACI|nr:hypothetical protein Bca52824_030471 [Brassica carinata]
MDVNSLPFPPTNHQVFVSFRGEELRCGFVSHLVEALQRHGVNVFIDKLESVGQDLSNLFARIEESTIALVIFSRRYTESRWCLDELAKIKERADQGLLKVIPIFFKVEPVTVKQLRGAFGDKFRDREWEYRCDKPRTDRWKEAIASVSCKTGLTLDKKSNESKFVRIIVKEVEKMLQPQGKFAVIPFPGGGQCMKKRQMDISRDSILVQENSYIANQIVIVSHTYMDIEYQNNGDFRPSFSNTMEVNSYHGVTNHQVFVSFRGEELRCGFVSHLVEALQRHGINVFIDKLESVGQDLSNLFARIEESTIALVIFSRRYTESRWCLDELAKIKERADQGLLKVLVPVFYGVDRSEVEQQIGKYREEFSKHEASEPKDRVTEWRNALKEAASLKEGLQSNEESSDLKLMEEIVSYVHGRLFPADKIGVNTRVLEIENLLSKQSWVVRSVGIWGMPGIGKTTIAKAAFDQMKGNFKSPRFIPNFEREFQKEGMSRLRGQHLPPHVKQKLDINRSITNNSQISVEERVFLVLDDVRNPINAESFLGGFEWFDPGSVIIITSRNKQVLVQCGMVEIYEVKGLDDKEGLKLFSQCAFGEPEPEDGHLKVSEMIVNYANGNAKALSYYGNELKGKKPEEMEEEFCKLKLNPPVEILEVFKNSYDELSDDEKNIFLDIACFFKGDTTDRVMQVLDGCGFFPCIGIDYLVEKSLVTICENRVEMHNLIQDVAKEIHNQEVMLGMGRRLCGAKSIQPLLDNEGIKPNGEDNVNVESILLEASGLSFVVDPGAFQEMCNLRLLKIYSSDPERRPGLDLSMGLLYLPYELRLFHWENYSLRSLPEEFDPDNLVELNMPYSQLEELWEGSRNLNSLKTINLHHSEKLVDIQELKDAHYLQLIDLQCCTSLQNFPCIEHLNHLQVLNLCGCTGIKSFPEVPQNIKELCLKGTSISEIPASIESLSKLVKLDLGNCKTLQHFLVKIYNMESLQLLNLSGCVKLKSFPEIPNRVENLQYLYLSGTAIEELHTSLSNMVCLKVLEVSKNLKSPFSLKDLKDLKVIEIDGEIHKSS